MNARRDNQGTRTEVAATLRWAAELAISLEPQRSELGLRTLTALADSGELDDTQLATIEATLLAVVDEPVQELREIVGSDLEGADADFSNVVVVTRWGQPRGAENPESDDALPSEPEHHDGKDSG